tara:strand:+ start:3408 stop:4022 length:615 start_codon:yes stop_codon:yes gene_type:complete
MNPYTVLGINENANTATIKEAYRNLARKHHPDRGGDVQKFKEATEAYSILSDEQKRNRYHRPSPTFGFEHIFGQEFNPFADLFHFQQPPQSKPTQVQTEDSDIFFNFKVNLEQIKKGASVNLSYPRNNQCGACKGSGGAGKTSCKSCGGSGMVISKPNPNSIQQITCPSCYGKGLLFEEPCETCQTKGFVQETEQITIKIEQQQ